MKQIPRNLTDIVGPAICAESEAAAFLLGLDLASPNDHDKRLSLALALIESAKNLKSFEVHGLRVERRQDAS